MSTIELPDKSKPHSLTHNTELDIFESTDGGVYRLDHRDEDDTWIGHDRSVFIRNTSREDQPVWIRIDTALWSARYHRTSVKIDWSTINLPIQMIAEFRATLADRLRRLCPLEMRTAAAVLRQVSAIYPALNGPSSAGTLQQRDLQIIMSRLPKGSKSYFRSFYKVMVALGIKGCTLRKWEKLREVVLAPNSMALPKVRGWDPKRGPLTTSEFEVLLQHVSSPKPLETDLDHFCRVSMRTLLALGRRSVQMLEVKADGILASPYDPRLPPIIIVPGAKNQRNDAPRIYDITNDLFGDLMEFSKRREIAEAQRRSGYFFTLPISMCRHPSKLVSDNQFLRRIRSWTKRQNIISPRTQMPLFLDIPRFRHTVATQLVKRGWTIEDLQDFLEHSNDRSALTYVSAVGNDLSPVMKDLDTRLDNVFSNLTSHFKGKIVPRPLGKISKPIVSPRGNNRAIIGQCGLTTKCPRTPFNACISGCPNFLLFKDADTDASEKWIFEEHKRWKEAERSPSRDRIITDFARMANGIGTGRE